MTHTTYLTVARVIDAAGKATISDICRATHLDHARVFSALTNLRRIDALASTGRRGGHVVATYSLTRPLTELEAQAAPQRTAVRRHDATALERVWPMPVPFPPVVSMAPRRPMPMEGAA